MPHRPLVNRQAVRAKFASAGYRTSREVLDHLDAIVGAAIKAGIRGMSGRGRKTISVEEVHRGRLLGDPTASGEASSSPKKIRKVNRGLLKR
jgi:hypothetical protein